MESDPFEIPLDFKQTGKISRRNIELKENWNNTNENIFNSDF